MIQVSQDAFFGVVGKLDVHPRPNGPYDQRWGCKSEWLLQQPPYSLVGVSDGGTVFEPNRYFVTEEFHQRYAEQFERYPPAAQTGAAHA